MGMYFSGHPFDDFTSHAKKLGAVSIGDILAGTDEESPTYADRDSVIVAGIITSRISKQTRAGAPMAFIKIEDRFGEMELVVFPKVLEKYTYFLSPETPIAVLGNLSLEEDAAPKLLASKIELLSAEPPADIAPMKEDTYSRKREARNAPVEARPTAQAAPIPQKPQALFLIWDS